MSSFIMPISPAGPARFRMQQVIVDRAYIFQFTFNGRESRWYMDVLDATTREQLRSGIKLVADYPLLRSFMSEDRPNAEFIAMDTENTGRDAETVDELGGRVLVGFKQFNGDFP